MKRNLILLAGIFVLFHSRSSPASQCDDLSLELGVFDGRLVELLNEIKGIDPQLINAEKTPDWDDFDNLEQIIKKVREIKTNLETQGKLAEVEKTIIELGKIAASDPALQNLLQRKKPITNENYQPTEYPLKLLYQKLITDLNHELPRSLRIHFPRLSPDERGPVLTEKAMELVSHVREKFLELFPTTGFNTKEEYLQMISSDPKLNEILDFVFSDKLEISIRRAFNARWWLPKVGFQNQFVTGSSNGSLWPEGRNNTESVKTFTPREEYDKYDAELKPKYGSIRPSPESGKGSRNSDGQYGEDIYILDETKVSERTTWTFRDSLGMRERGGFWDIAFIPWSNRELMVPYMLKNWKSGLVGDGYSTDILKSGHEPYNNYYLETQIFGPLTLDHVKAFEFTKSPPEGEFLAELQRRGVEIRDGRSWPPTIWSP